jgi:pimeloyl-ACP methyl ester carboxylesterase
MAPAVAQTITHARGLKRREAESQEKERLYGQRYPEPGGCGEGRSMAEVMERLKAIPFNPKPYNGVTSTLLFSMADVIPMMLECRKSTCGRLYSYPEPFYNVVIESEDGTPISGVVAIHDDGRPRPALLMVHGLFGSKRIWFSQQVILSAYYGWGYNVMAIDLRFFGESKLYSDAPGTGGWKEGQDIIAAVKFLKSHDEVTSVGVMGGSYGGASAMCAAYQSEPKDLIDGGIISWGGYGYVPTQVGYISTPPKPWEPFFPIFLYFMGCYTLTMGKMVRDYSQFMDFLTGYSASYYGVDPEEILDRSSAALHVDEIETPLLMIGADDDPVILDDQAAIMAEKARGNPWVEVWTLPRGGHCAFSTVDKQWMGGVVRNFYNYWAKPGDGA